MKLNRWLIAVALIGTHSSTSQVLAAEPVDAVQNLKRENELLNEKVKSLEEKFKALQEQVEQKVKVADRKRELDTEAADAKFKDAIAKSSPSLFKVPDWVTGVRLINDLRMRYDAAYAPDRDFVTRWRIRPRLRLGGIATLKDDFEIGFRLASAPSVGRDSGGDPLSTNQTFEDNASRKPIGVDWAFARWSPIHTSRWTGSFAVGKLENPPNYTENVFDVD